MDIPSIKSMLTHDNEELRYEATRSAGELEAKICTSDLIQLLDDDDKDFSIGCHLVAFPN
jgi:HEAT repeat protein